MSRSYRKVAKFPVCCVGHKGIKKWKENSRRGRRAREKEQMNGIVVDEEGYDEEAYPEEGPAKEPVAEEAPAEEKKPAKKPAAKKKAAAEE